MVIVFCSDQSPDADVSKAVIVSAASSRGDCPLASASDVYR